MPSSNEEKLQKQREGSQAYLDSLVKEEDLVTVVSDLRQRLADVEAAVRWLEKNAMLRGDAVDG